MLAPDDLKDLPDEVLAEMGENTSTQNEEILHSLAGKIVSLRKEAIDERRASGIEELWLTCEEAYVGLDDANRGEFANARWAKPLAMNGPLTSESSRRDAIKSTAFVRLTARYTDAGAAKLSEISLPMDGKAFSLTPTTEPDLVKAAEDTTPATIQGQPVMKPGDNPNDPSQPATVGDVAQHDMQIALTCSEKAESRILDWLTLSKYRSEMRKVEFDGARIGTGILKGPFPQSKQSSASSKDAQGNYTIEVVNKIFPGVKWADPWNFYPDASCGDDVHNGEYCFELEYLSRKKLRELKKDPSYLGKQIDIVLGQGPDNANPDSRNPNEKAVLKDKRFKVWYFYGTIAKHEFDVACANKEIAGSVVDDDVFVIVTLVNETVIKAVINPSPSGKFPYRIFNWQRRAGSWAGIGVAEQLSMPQRAVNAAVRAMFDNAGISSGVQIVLDRGSIEPADGEWNVGRNKLWYKSADATVDDVRKAFVTFEIPSLQQQLMSIVDWGMKQAEEATSIPLVTQGFSGTSTPDTYGAAQLQNNNANQLLRDIGHRLDDTITEPMIFEYYDYLLLDPDVPADEKGSFDIDAHGTSSLVERYIQAQEIQQLFQISLNPASKLDPSLVVTQLLASKHFDPSKFQYTPEQLAKMEQQPSPMAPVVQAAEIRAKAMVDVATAKDQTAQAIQQAKDQTTQQVEQAKNDRDAQYQQSLRQRDTQDAQIALEKLAILRDTAAMNERLTMMEYSMKKGISLDAIKADLAATSAKLQTEERLAMQQLVHGKTPAVDAPIAPPVQVPGRAPNGHAFEQV